MLKMGTQVKNNRIKGDLWSNSSVGNPKNQFGLLVDEISVPGLTIKQLDTYKNLAQTEY